MGSMHCWYCGGRLVGRNGQWGTATNPPLFAVVKTPLDQEVRVHKKCVANAEAKPVTAQESQHG